MNTIKVRRIYLDVFNFTTTNTETGFTITFKGRAKNKRDHRNQIEIIIEFDNYILKYLVKQLKNVAVNQYNKTMERLNLFT